MVRVQILNDQNRRGKGFINERRVLKVKNVSLSSLLRETANKKVQVSITN